jgi:hypothetical protein
MKTPQFRHSRAGGNPVGLFNGLLIILSLLRNGYFAWLDSRVRGNDDANLGDVCAN